MASRRQSESTTRTAARASVRFGMMCPLRTCTCGERARFTATVHGWRGGLGLPNDGERQSCAHDRSTAAKIATHQESCASRSLGREPGPCCAKPRSYFIVGGDRRWRARSGEIRSITFGTIISRARVALAAENARGATPRPSSARRGAQNAPSTTRRKRLQVWNPRILCEQTKHLRRTSCH